jgi:hypothetical protein
MRLDMLRFDAEEPCGGNFNPLPLDEWSDGGQVSGSKMFVCLDLDTKFCIERVNWIALILPIFGLIGLLVACASFDVVTNSTGAR